MLRACGEGKKLLITGKRIDKYWLGYLGTWLG